jgi:hypothetical protein
MSEGSSDAEADGRASKLDSGHVKLFGWKTGRKVCLDAMGMMMVASVMPRDRKKLV